MRAGSGQTRALSVSGTAATMRFDWLARPRLSPSSQCHASSFRSRYRSICSFSPPFQRSRKHQPPTSLSHTAKPRLCACYHTKEALVHREWQFFFLVGVCNVLYGEEFKIYINSKLHRSKFKKSLIREPETKLFLYQCSGELQI